MLHLSYLAVVHIAKCLVDLLHGVDLAEGINREPSITVKLDKFRNELSS